MQYYKQLNLQKRDVFYKPYIFAYQYTDKAVKIVAHDDSIYIIPDDVYLLIADKDEGITAVLSIEQVIQFSSDIKIVCLTPELEFKAKRISRIERSEDIVTHAPFDKMVMIGIDDQFNNTSILISNDIPRRLPKDCHFADLI